MAEDTKGRVVEKRMEFDAPIGKVWRAITDPAELSRWFGDEAEVDLRPGAEGAIFWEDYGRHAIRVEEVEPETRFVWSWMHETGVPFDEAASTRVEWTLTPREDGGTSLYLRESGFRTDEHYGMNDHGWDSELGELVELLAG